MKNILIPTTLEADTVYAVKTAIRHTDNNNCAITLMLLQEVAECYSSLYVLNKTKSSITKAQNKNGKLWVIAIILKIKKINI